MKLLDIAERLASALKAHPKMHAMWLEGSYATGKYSNDSDIDIWLDVDDGTFGECIAFFREKLESIVNLTAEASRGIYSDSPKLIKHTFYLQGFTRNQCIELDLQEHSRQYKFSKHKETIKVLFDKDNTIRWVD